MAALSHISAIFHFRHGFTAVVSPPCFSTLLQGWAAAQALSSATFRGTEVVPSDKIMGYVKILKDSRKMRQERVPEVRAGAEKDLRG